MILRYTLFFGLVFGVFMGIAFVALSRSWSASKLPVGLWVDYDDNIPFIKVYQTKMGFRDRTNKLFMVEGNWRDKVFYTGDGSTLMIAARELSNDDLEVHMAAFKDGDHRVFTAVKRVRAVDEVYPYPILRKNQVVTYPPPRGLIRPGMLVADLQVLPWQPYDRKRPYLIAGESADAKFGTEIDDGWPTVWCYKSDNPDLPELRVTTAKGRVTEVSGGAEETNEPVWTRPPDADPNSDLGDGFIRRCIRFCVSIVLGR